jgi:hypothetical protein
MTNIKLTRNPAENQNALPDKPSELIRVALRDLKEAEASPDYAVVMDEWHEPDSDGVCLVCLAGSVMAGTLKSDIDRKVFPHHFDKGTKRKLEALDYFRDGDILCGFNELGIPYPFQETEVEAPQYDGDNPEEFHEYLTDLADALMEGGF